MTQVGTRIGCTTECDCRVLAAYQSAFCPRRGWRPTTSSVTCWCSGVSSSTTTSTSCRRRWRTPGSATVDTVMRHATPAGRAFRYRSARTTRGFAADAASASSAPAPCVAGAIPWKLNFLFLRFILFYCISLLHRVLCLIIFIYLCICVLLRCRSGAMKE